ncbi:MAG: NAD(P)/FAD-dependent oxidoreductase [Candidatus Binataceae bacterium]
MKTIVIVGGGFAGLAAAIGAARELDALGIHNGEVKIALINRGPFHCIRVRNYERDLSEVRVPLDDVLGPVGVERIDGEVSAVDAARRRLSFRFAGSEQALEYDRLVLAAGSLLYEPDLPGLRQSSFNVDTYDAALRLNEHIARLPAAAAGPGQYTVAVVGAGLTGIETACEMPGKLREAAARAGVRSPRLRTILADHAPHVGSDIGDSARPVIEQALASLKIELRTGVVVRAIDAHGLVLESGERLVANTVVWTAGMRAHPLTAQFSGQRDRFGRLSVDDYLRVTGTNDVFAAGDVATLPIDGEHSSVMSCQHARPMGRFAGHNAVCDLLGKPMLPLHIDWYVTCLDLGPWGAVYTEGWDRHVAASGREAKAIKQNINCVRIYPPRSRNRRDILESATPAVQAPPVGHD